jgi:hypothetical protein
VALRGVELVIGDPGGIEVVAMDGPASAPRELVAAIAPSSGRNDAKPAVQDQLQDVLDDASSVTGKIERTLSIFTDIAEGRLDPAALGDEVDALLGLLERLDREQHLREALRLARALAMLLALLERWVELVGSLKTALHAAQVLLDESGQAWALHELGSLHLAADDLSDADTMLSEAREMRERIGERRAMALTERNLGALCQMLRGGLHGSGPEGPGPTTWPSWPTMLAFAIVPLLIGGAAGAVIRGSGGSIRTVVDVTPSTQTSAHIPSIPTVPEHRGSGGQGTTPATPGQRTHTIVLETTGKGAGTIESSDGAIECRDYCSHSYEEGKAIILTAKSADGSEFVGWDGACTGEGACQLTMSADRSVTATFDPQKVALTVSFEGQGKGTVKSTDGQFHCELTCTTQYPVGAKVILTAANGGSSLFEGWGGACRGSGVGSCTLTLDKDSSVTAGFRALRPVSPSDTTGE